VFSQRQLFTWSPRSVGNGCQRREQCLQLLREPRKTAGTAVASTPAVGRFFLAWLTLALLLFGLARFTRAGDELAIAGFVSATDQEANEGYFSVGGDAMVVTKQGTGLQRWLKAHSGQNIRITLEPARIDN
jgi:hypothetical protein